tara:strand:- start:384 stop:569 length:186 start_codon:yes stop_codon:yes gene_type:complete
MAWNNNNLSDSQYLKQLKTWQSRDGVQDIKREMKKMKKPTNKNKPQKEKSLFGKIFSVFTK